MLLGDEVRFSLFMPSLIVSFCFGISNFANAGWIDAATGQPVQTSPYTGQTASTRPPGDPQANRGDPNRAYLPETGQNLVWDATCHTWIDASTGKEVHTNPFTGQTAATRPPGDPQANRGDPNRAYLPKTGQNLVWQPCPPPQTALSSGLYLGGELAKNWGRVRSTESRATTDVITNQFTDTADPLGGGFLIGYKFAPWANNIIVSPFASFDFLNSPVNHTFPGGSYLGTTANFMGTGGVKIGPQLSGGVWLYGIAGVSVLNETLNINFIPVASSQSAWVAGGTVGFGGAFQPNFLQGFGRPVSVFAEYQHTWWQSANFNTPAASPLFNYNFARQDDVVKLGFTVDLSAPPQAPVRTYPVKALPSK
jgi:hypothetical protein